MKRWFFLDPTTHEPCGPYETEVLARLAADAALATDPPVSEAQRRAMEAAAHGHSTLGIPRRVAQEFLGKDGVKRRAAGVLNVTHDGRVLLVRRADLGDGHPFAGHWQLPGGVVEDGEDDEAAARREHREELGRDCLGPLKALDRSLSEDGTAFTTFARPVTSRFRPTLDHESDAHKWAPLSRLPQPLHPGLDATLARQLRHDRPAKDLSPADWQGLTQGLLKFLAEEQAEPEHRQAQDERPRRELCAFDKHSTRTYDDDGRMHVAVNNISKATVNPYRGDEIPGWQDLKLDPKRVYHLLRDPKELEAAAPTFNNLPVLSKHVPVDVDHPEPELVMGSTGTDAEWKPPFLRNSLVLWVRKAIDGVESEKQHELSCAYRYDPDMTPGEYEGQPYDGVMRNIRGNHVALVEDGRAGPDVVVGDSALKLETDDMPAPKKPIQLHYRTATALVALRRQLKPLLAKDAKVSLGAAFVGVMPKNWKTKKPTVVLALDAALKGKLARDADLKKMHSFVDSLDEEMEPDEDDADVGEDEPDVEGLRDIEKPDDVLYDSPEHEAVVKHLGDKGFKLSKDDVAQVGQLMKKKEDGALDADDPDDPDQQRGPAKGAKSEGAAPVEKGAMDAAIKTAVKAAENATIKRLNDIAEAKELVRPHIGVLAQAMDSAEAVYRLCLKEKRPELALDGVHPSALRALVELLPAERPKLAADAAPDHQGFADRYPMAAKLKVA